LLLGRVVTFSARFEFGFFDGIGLHEVIEVLLFSPMAVEVVEAGLPLGRVEHDRILPVRQPDRPAGRLTAVEFCGPMDRLGQGEPPAGGSQGLRIADLGLDFNDVRNKMPPFLRER